MSVRPLGDVTGHRQPQTAVAKILETRMDRGKPSSLTEAFKRITGDALGAGLALVVLPGAALLFGIKFFSKYATAGLPVMAIFGIMILFGALSLVATLFARLGLANKDQALALPEGSIRAAIALSLIVLFAIISIMLYRSMSEPYRITGLSDQDRAAIIKTAGDRLIGNADDACVAGPATAELAASAASAAAAEGKPAPQPQCAAADKRYTLLLLPPPRQDATDLAKQLLILVGTLMTSVTSFYFATRGATPSSPSGAAGTPPPAPTPGPAPVPTPAPAAGAAPAPAPVAAPDRGSAPPTRAAADPEAHADGCNVAITDPTPDEALPAAKGGVAS